MDEAGRATTIRPDPTWINLAPCRTDPARPRLAQGLRAWRAKTAVALQVGCLIYQDNKSRSTQADTLSIARARKLEDARTHSDLWQAAGHKLQCKAASPDPIPRARCHPGAFIGIIFLGFAEQLRRIARGGRLLLSKEGL